MTPKNTRPSSATSARSFTPSSPAVDGNATPRTATDFSRLFAQLPGSIPAGADRAKIEQMLLQIFQQIKAERRKVQEKRRAAERRWEEYVPDQGEVMRVLEECNTVEQQLSAKEKDLLDFYKTNFPHSQLLLSASGTRIESGETEATTPTVAVDSLAVETTATMGNRQIVLPPSPAGDKPISPFLKYLLNGRDTLEKEAVPEKKPRPVSFSPSPSQKSVGSSSSRPARTSFDATFRSDLDRWRSNLDKELHFLDDAKHPNEPLQIPLGIPAPITVESSAAARHHGEPKLPSPLGKRKSVPGASTEAIITRSLAPGWTIKIVENGGQSVSQADSKTMFVHQDATAAEVLVMALKKWRYLPEKVSTEMKGPRVRVTDNLLHSLQRDGWELLLLPLDAHNGNIQVLHAEQMLVDVLPKELPKDLKPVFIFRRNENAKVQEPSENTGGPKLEPRYVFKLDSSYVVPEPPTGRHPIDVKNWSRRYITFARQRHLLFFKSAHHAQWAQNILHEVDLGRVASVEPASVRMVTSAPGSGETMVTSANSIVLRTRSRHIFLCTDTAEERDRLVAELMQICRFVQAKWNLPTSSVPKHLKGPVRQTSELSVLNHEQPNEETPLHKLIERLAVSLRMNDIDLLRTKENATACRAVLQTLKALSIRVLVPLLTKEGHMSAEELMPMFRDGLIEDAQVKSTGGSGGKASDHNSNVITSMKKLFRKEKGGPSTSKSPTGSNPTLSGSHDTILRTSNLFGIPLAQLSVRYDVSESGVPCVPPIVTLSIQYLCQNGLETPGLFRVAGSVKRMEQLKKAWEETTNVEDPSSVQMDFGAFNVHDVAGVLKQFFRDLPEPLLSSKLYPVFIAVDKLEEEKGKVKALRNLVVILAPSHRHVLEELLMFLQLVASFAENHVDDGGVARNGNMMTSANLAVCFGPNILREPIHVSDGHSPSGLGPSASNTNLSSAATAAVSRVHHAASTTVFSETLTSASSTEIAESSAVVNVIRLMIDHANAIFTLDDAMLDEIQKMGAAPVKS